MRPLLALPLALAACASPARTVIAVQPGVELVCTARAPGAAAPPPPALVAVAPDAAAAPDAAFQLDEDAATPRLDPTPAVREVDPARLVLLPGVERSWSVVRVVRCEGARAVIVGRDARISSRPLASLRALRFAAGVEVMALWEGGPTPYHAVVTSLRGDEVHVRYDDGSEESLDTLRLDAVTVTEAPPAHVCPLAAGAAPAVLVPRDAWRRAAVVVECGGANALVETVRGGREEVPAAGLTRAAFGAGDRVMIRWRDGNDWPARVDRAEGRTLAVTYEDGSEETVALGQVVAWAAADGATRAAAAYACPR